MVEDELNALLEATSALISPGVETTGLRHAQRAPGPSRAEDEGVKARKLAPDRSSNEPKGRDMPRAGRQVRESYRLMRDYMEANPPKIDMSGARLALWYLITFFVLGGCVAICLLLYVVMRSFLGDSPEPS
jgi:hypothetical protein